MTYSYRLIVCDSRFLFISDNKFDSTDKNDYKRKLMNFTVNNKDIVNICNKLIFTIQFIHSFDKNVSIKSIDLYGVTTEMDIYPMPFIDVWEDVMETVTYKLQSYITSSYSDYEKEHIVRWNGKEDEMFSVLYTDSSENLYTYCQYYIRKLSHQLQKERDREYSIIYTTLFTLPECLINLILSYSPIDYTISHTPGYGMIFLSKGDEKLNLYSLITGKDIHRELSQLSEFFQEL